MTTCQMCHKSQTLLWYKDNEIRCSSCIINNILHYSLLQNFVMLGEYHTSKSLETIKPHLLEAMVEKKISSLMSYNENMQKRLIFQYELK